MIEQMKLEEEERRKAAREGRLPPPSRQNTGQDNEEGYFAYMQRQVQERTQNLSFAGDNMDRLEETSSGWANDVNKYVQNQKKKAVLGGKFLIQRGLSVLAILTTVQPLGRNSDSKRFWYSCLLVLRYHRYSSALDMFNEWTVSFHLCSLLSNRSRSPKCVGSRVLGDHQLDLHILLSTRMP